MISGSDSSAGREDPGSPSSSTGRMDLVLCFLLWTEAVAIGLGSPSGLAAAGVTGVSADSSSCSSGCICCPTVSSSVWQAVARAQHIVMSFFSLENFLSNISPPQLDSEFVQGKSSKLSGQRILQGLASVLSHPTSLRIFHDWGRSLDLSALILDKLQTIKRKPTR